MKQHVLNLVLVLVIAIGGMFLVQPPTVLANSDTCTVQEGEDPCPECFSSDCMESSVQECGLLQEVGEDNFVICGYEGGTDPVEN